ncbi:hypothetical protein PoHVEF18_005778 [Penicillium ochrochloron]
MSSTSSHSASHELPDEPFRVAKERSWFAEDYTPFKTFVVDDMLSTGPLEVIGVGTVHLPVKSLPYDMRKDREHMELCISNTCYTPLGVAYMLRATWPVAEQQKFEALKSSQDASESQIEAMTLNLTEKAWLKKHWVNEFRVLRSYGLSIYYEEDREEGRKILQKLMENDADDDYDK